MNICVFDTETTSLEKPFCYNIGYTIIDTEEWQVVLKKDRVVEQVWHNNMCFASAYYADKREIYVERMRKHETLMDKFGYITREMARDFEAYGVTMAFAFNSDFDERVFAFNCDWFKCINPFDNIKIKDIRAFFHKFIVDDKFKQFCEENEYFTESGNYSTTAETAFRYLVDNEFTEEHTALADSEIEGEILRECVVRGANLEDDYTAKKSIPRKVTRVFTVKKNGEVAFSTEFETVRYYKSNDTVMLK